MSKRNKILLYVLLVFGLFVSFKLFIPENNLDDYIKKNLGIEDRLFKEYVVFYPQHQDDEVLWGGSAIRRSINRLGADHVFVVLVSDGTGVNVFKDKTYKNTSRKEKEQLRDNEFYAALNYLGVNKENIIILANIDNKVGNHFDLMREVALNFEDKYENVTHIAQSYKYDNHPMHRKNGKVIYDLYKEGKIKDAMFYLKPKYVEKVPIDKIVIYKAKDSEDYEAIVNACNEYKVINKEKGRRGIGYISSHRYFDNLLKDSDLTSFLHLPE